MGYFAACMLGHAVISHLLPHGAWRTAWQATSIGFEASVIGWNFSGGINLAF